MRYIKYYKYFWVKEMFVVYLYDIEKFKRRKRRSKISILLLFVFHVNQINAKWPLQGNAENGPLCFYHISLKGP